MPQYYFDIETEGTDPQQDKIITIQYQQLEDARPVGNFTILAEWEWNEKEIVRSILEKGLFEVNWDFVPVGNGLKFDLTFLIEKTQKHKLLDWDPARIKYFFYKKPMIDISPILVLMNEGKFEGASAMAFTKKRDSGEVVPSLYRSGNYPAILKYVEEEKNAILDLYGEVRSVLAALGRRRRESLEKPFH